MNTRAMISFDIPKGENGERYYHILIPNGAPYKEAQEVMQDVIALIAAQEHNARQEAEKKEENKVEETV